jgi:TolB-like protein/DNA-binding SARP family transcriptional activator
MVTGSIFPSVSITLIRRLHMFGLLSLEVHSEHEIRTPSRKQHLALLALLASTGRRGMARETLVSYLWAEHAPQRARRNLAQTLHELRRGTATRDTVVADGDVLSLDSTVITAEVTDFRAAFDRADYDAVAKLYSGPFLQGFFLNDAPLFEEWADAQRLELDRQARHAMAQLAEMSARAGQLMDSVSWLRRAVACDPLDSALAERLVVRLIAAGDPAGALTHARVHNALLQQEFGSGISGKLKRIADRLLSGEDVSDLATDETVAPRVQQGSVSVPIDAAAPTARSLGSTNHERIDVTHAAAPPVPQTPAPVRPVWTSIAVLPFVNRAHNSEDDFLGDGITEQVISSLARLPGMRVAARTSAFAFKGRTIDVKEIGRQLGVSWLVEGTVRREKNYVRVTAALIRAEDGHHYWAKQYQLPQDDVFVIEERIARAVVGAWIETIPTTETRQLISDETERLVVAPTQQAKAYELHLLGKHFASSRTIEGIRDAKRCFEAAIACDPNFAAAHAASGETIVLLAVYGAIPPQEAMPAAVEAATRALRLDPALGEPRAILGRVAALYDLDLMRAAEHYQASFAVNPRLPMSHHWYALDCLMPAGRFDEAAAELRYAEKLDPLSPIIASTAGFPWYLRGLYATAVSVYEEALRVSPDFGMTHYFRAQAELGRGNVDAAMRELRDASKQLGASVEVRSTLAYAHAIGGNTAEARAILDELLALERGAYVSAVLVANVYVGLGELENAMMWLERAVDQRAVELIWLPTRPIYEPLRRSENFSALLKRAGIAALNA